MNRRFGIYDTGGKKTADRYTVIDRVPHEPSGVIRSIPSAHTYYSYFGMSAYPFHPQGIGMHGEMPARSYRDHQRTRFRSLGKPIKLDALPEQARKAAEQFIRACEAE